MENQKGFYQKIVTPRFCDCDYKKQARLAVIVGYMADIAGLAYTEKGYSHKWLWDIGLVFLVSKGSLHINRMPNADEEIKITTWEHSVKGVVFNRMFEIFDGAGEMIISSHTGWVLINPDSRSLLRPSEFTGQLDLHPNKNVDTLPFSKIKLDKTVMPNATATRKLVYSDIDANGHVYNAVYVSIASDILSKNEHNYQLIDFRINFIHEAVLGEEMLVKKFISWDNSIIVKGYLGEKESFECEFIFA